jgi:hypothetical protein
MLTVQFNSINTSKYLIQVFDMTGRAVKSDEANATEGINMHELDLGALAKGIYMLSLESEGTDRQILRVVLQ